MLGSIKPYKWHGFQAGNRHVMDLMLLHTTCEWAVIRDDTATDAPWLDPARDTPDAGHWREDLRSRSFWQALQHGAEPACAACAGRLDSPLVISPGLSFCSQACLQRFSAHPARIWREPPSFPPTAQIAIACRSCADQQVWGMISTPDPGAEALAEWLIEHCYSAAEGAGLSALGCWLQTQIILPAESDRHERSENHAHDSPAA
jgi:hypothetical protein